ncbi:MAG TPA: sigma-70 family RNA polymerase sigma factor [Xanthobacteraceae bacterium]|jgi:RNA polymerase sigma-70 factor (ECF subfamily)
MNIGIRQLASAAATATATPQVAPPDALDETLIRHIACGDRRAMRTLFVRHQLRVYRFVLRIVNDRSAAEDVITEVFFDVWKKAGRFEGRSAVSTWLLGIARHKALTAVAKPRPAESLDDVQASNVIDPADDPETAMHRKEQQTLVRHCLRALSPEHGQIIDLVYYQEKSTREIAEILGIPDSTVKTRMFYARRRLAMLIEAAEAERPVPHSVH